jgi:hypothetical protein
MRIDIVDFDVDIHIEFRHDLPGYDYSQCVLFSIGKQRQCEPVANGFVDRSLEAISGSNLFSV